MEIDHSNSDNGTTTLQQELHFLVCVDKNSESHVALRLACVKAKKRNGFVDILHVIEPTEGETLFGVSDKMRSEQEEEAKLLLHELSAIAESITGQKPKLLLKEGAVGETIVKTAQEVQVNMLVLGVAAGSSRGKLVAWLSSQLGDKLWMPIMRFVCACASTKKSI